MVQVLIKNKTKTWEVLVQLSLILVVFVFYVFDHHDAIIEGHEIAFYLNYVLAAVIINNILMPRLLYKKKYLGFSLTLLILIGLVIFIEEGVIEKIYFPDTRGTRFPGVFYNLLSAMPTITILVGGKFAWDALVQKKKLDELESLVKESELQYLKSQVNPHFLFNNLNNLYAYALEESKRTPQIILELSGILRYMLYECKEAYVPIQKELEHLENFINLSKLQFEGRGKVHYQVAEDCFDGKVIAPLILSVFVENAFKHSSASLSENIDIDIQIIHTTNNELQMICVNTFDEQSNVSDLSKGIGLNNVKKRLELLYPDKHELFIQSENNLYRVNLRLKLD